MFVNLSGKIPIFTAHLSILSISYISYIHRIDDVHPEKYTYTFINEWRTRLYVIFYVRKKGKKFRKRVKPYLFT